MINLRTNKNTLASRGVFVCARKERDGDQSPMAANSELETPPCKSRFREPLLGYGTALFLCLAVVFCLFHLWRTDLRISMHLDGDGLFHQAMIKATIDHGWYLNNPRLGAP